MHNDSQRRKAIIPLAKRAEIRRRFFGLSGFAFVFAAPWPAEVVGIPDAIILRVVGMSLPGLACALLLNASRDRIDRVEAWSQWALTLPAFPGAVCWFLCRY